MENDEVLIVATSAQSTSSQSTSSEGTYGAVAVPITLANANALTAAGERFIASSPTIVVGLDMKNVEATSVAVAVALAWLAVASREGKELCLSNLSSDFNGVVEFSGIASMFADHTESSVSTERTGERLS